jgi:hypothetical protein
MKSVNKNKLCAEPNCNNPIEVAGFCHHHYLYIVGVQRKWKSQTSEYKIWSKMKNRCDNPNNRAYARYGGRGIKVCKRWSESFDNFLQDMGKKPSSIHQIDRVDNNKGYEPSNCRWVLPVENMRNRSNCVLNEAMVKEIKRKIINGVDHKSIAKEYNVHVSSIRQIVAGKSWVNV